MRKKIALVMGAGGFIGGHLVLHLLENGYEVVGIDLKEHEYINLREKGCEFMQGDLRCWETMKEIILHTVPDEIYQLAADMGGAGFIFTGDNDANIMHNSAAINLNLVDILTRQGLNPKVFYSSSACIYPAYNQDDPENPICNEDSAYPAAPDSEYGWEKLFSERLYMAFARNKKMKVRIARFHNIFGPYGTFQGGREKAPAALCRKVAEIPSGGSVEIWGDGKQTRSFLYIDECVEGIVRLMDSDLSSPVNIGSEEMLTIDELAYMAARCAGKHINILHVPGPQGVRGRCSDNRLIESSLGWKPNQPLEVGLKSTYDWIEKQLRS